MSRSPNSEFLKQQRQLDELEQRIYEQHTRASKRGVVLHVGHQSFLIEESKDDPECEPGVRPDWFRRALAVALARMVRGING